MVLSELMRHESIGTPLKHDVGPSAEATADALLEAVGTSEDYTTPAHKNRGVRNTPDSSTGETS